MTTFCETSVAALTINTLEAIRTTRSNGTFIGPAGVGKTYAASHYVALNPDSAWMLTASAASGNAARHLFQRFCKLCKLSTSGSIADMQDRLFAYDFSGQVLIIDEAQNLNQQGIRELLYLNDHAYLSIVFCGNEEVIKRTHVDKGPLATIGSRIQYRTMLSLITPEDCDAIAMAFDVSDPAALTLLRGIGAQSQARGLTFVLEAARLLAGPGKQIERPHLRTIIDQFPQYRPALTKR